MMLHWKKEFGWLGITQGALIMIQVMLLQDYYREETGFWVTSVFMLIVCAITLFIQQSFFEVAKC